MVGSNKNWHSQVTKFDKMQELLRGCTHRLRLDFIDEAIGNADIAVIEQLANDQLVELLAVLQAYFGSVHLGEEEDNVSASCKRKQVIMKGKGRSKPQKQHRNLVTLFRV